MYRYVIGYQALTPLKNFVAYYINQHNISRDENNQTFIVVSTSPNKYMYAFVNDTYETVLTTISGYITNQSKSMILNSGEGFVEPEVDKELADKILAAKILNTYGASIAESTVYMDVKNSLDDLFNIINHRSIADNIPY